jgi:cell division septation protein DedD
MRVDESKTTAGYAVQVATVPTMAEADGLLTQLKRDGLTKSYVRSPEPGSVAQLFSVEMAFDDKASAEQAVSQLKGRGLTRSRVIQVYTDKNASKPMDRSAQPPTAP